MAFQFEPIDGERGSVARLHRSKTDGRVGRVTSSKPHKLHAPGASDERWSPERSDVADPHPARRRCA